MQTSPLVSIVMPLRNGETWVDESIRSALAQDLDDIELLVVDDGSQDRGPRIVASYAAADPRVRLLANAGQGGAAARNHGVAAARGRFLAFLDSDDIMPTAGLARLVDSLETTGSDLAVGDSIFFQPRWSTRRGAELTVYETAATGIRLDDAPQLLRDRVCWNKAFRRSWWEASGIAFADARRSNDIVAMSRALALASIDVVPDVVYLYRIGAGRSSMTSQRTRPQAILDHLEQERAAADELRPAVADATYQEYLAGILAHDLWVNVGDALEVGDDAAGLVDEVADRVRAIVDGASEPTWQSIDAEQRAVYERLLARR